MNKLLLTAALLSTCCISCYKEPDPVDVRAILISHKWLMTAETVNGSPVTTDCALNEELTFRNDSTGYFYNATPCDTSLHHPDSVSFRWSVSTDRKNIYFRDQGGVPGKNFAMAIDNITDDNLRLFGMVNSTSAQYVFGR